MNYVDYDNSEIRYERKRDPREFNVVESLKTCNQRKAELPKVDDDHVCKSSLESYIASLEGEVRELKNESLVRELKELFLSGGDVIIQDNVDFETAMTTSVDINLNLNGKNITVANDTVGDGVFHVTGGTLTIDGEGVINGVGKNDYNMAIWADGGNVVINNGTFTNVGATAVDDPTHMDLIYTKNGGSLEINGGFFRCATPKWTLNKNDSTESTIIVKGGTFVNYNPSMSETEPGGIVSFVAEGYKVVSEAQENGEIWYTVVAE